MEKKLENNTSEGKKEISFSEIPSLFRFGMIFFVVLVLYSIVHGLFFYEPLGLYERTGALIPKFIAPVFLRTLVITTAIYFLHKLTMREDKN